MSFELKSLANTPSAGSLCASVSQVSVNESISSLSVAERQHTYEQVVGIAKLLEGNLGACDSVIREGV